MLANKLNSRNTISITHKGKTFQTTVGSKVYEEQYCGLNILINSNDTIGFIPTGYEHRPDLMSNVFTDNVYSWWRICELNNIFDQYEQLKIGDRVVIPS